MVARSITRCWACRTGNARGRRGTGLTTGFGDLEAAAVSRPHFRSDRTISWPRRSPPAGSPTDQGEQLGVGQPRAASVAHTSSRACELGAIVLWDAASVIPPPRWTARLARLRVIVDAGMRVAHQALAPDALSKDAEGQLSRPEGQHHVCPEDGCRTLTTDQDLEL